jgi:hypothetical protein
MERSECCEHCFLTAAALAEGVGSLGTAGCSAGWSWYRCQNNGVDMHSFQWSAACPSIHLSCITWRIGNNSGRFFYLVVLSWHLTAALLSFGVVGAKWRVRTTLCNEKCSTEVFFSLHRELVGWRRRSWSHLFNSEGIYCILMELCPWNPTPLWPPQIGVRRLRLPATRQWY